MLQFLKQILVVVVKISVCVGSSAESECCKREGDGNEGSVVCKRGGCNYRVGPCIKRDYTSM